MNKVTFYHNGNFSQDGFAQPYFTSAEGYNKWLSTLTELFRVNNSNQRYEMLTPFNAARQTELICSVPAAANVEDINYIRVEQFAETPTKKTYWYYVDSWEVVDNQQLNVTVDPRDRVYRFYITQDRWLMSMCRPVTVDNTIRIKQPNMTNAHLLRSTDPQLCLDYPREQNTKLNDYEPKQIADESYGLFGSAPLDYFYLVFELKSTADETNFGAQSVLIAFPERYNYYDEALLNNLSSLLASEYITNEVGLVDYNSNTVVGAPPFPYGNYYGLNRDGNRVPIVVGRGGRTQCITFNVYKVWAIPQWVFSRAGSFDLGGNIHIQPSPLSPDPPIAKQVKMINPNYFQSFSFNVGEYSNRDICIWGLRPTPEAPIYFPTNKLRFFKRNYPPWKNIRDNIPYSYPTTPDFRDDGITNIPVTNPQVILQTNIYGITFTYRVDGENIDLGQFLSLILKTNTKQRYFSEQIESERKSTALSGIVGALSIASTYAPTPISKGVLGAGAAIAGLGNSIFNATQAQADKMEERRARQITTTAASELDAKAFLNMIKNRGVRQVFIAATSDTPFYSRYIVEGSEFNIANISASKMLNYSSDSQWQTIAAAIDFSGIPQDDCNYLHNLFNNGVQLVLFDNFTTQDAEALKL